jgi:branched-chain amino acid transport system permease protein
VAQEEASAMSLESLLQPFVYGVQIGLTYIIIALGLTLIFGIMNIFNFAHGEFYMLGAFSILYISGLAKVNYFLALVLCMLIVGLIGVFFERLFFARAKGRLVPIIIVATGLMWILQTAAQIIFGRQPRGMAEVFQGSVSILHVNISYSRIMAGTISIVLVAALYVFVYRTKLGRAMQAVSQDREAAALQGINIDRLSTLGFGLGCALAAVAGGIMAPIFFIEATMGLDALGKSMAIIILGGLGSIPGAVIGGLILGLVESYGQTFMGYPATVLPFVIIVLVLLFKRSGLMGRAV